MMLENKLGINNQLELNRTEERLSKKKAKDLYDLGKMNEIEVGTFKGLSEIHQYLFEDVYFFAGKVREVNIAKSNFRFAPVMYLNQSLYHIDTMPQTTFDEIVEKYVEMNIAHPFREGNGRANRIWLDLIFKKVLHKVVDWNKIDKEDYLLAMERSPIRDIEIKHLLQNALVDEINSREVFMKGIDISYYYEGYTEYNIDDL
ncbi:Fic family protein [Lysinibacillus xylanilyticus]|uniref:protein adenylyltransferase Fic n=1 Tax=Lysinibacillus xylanilyticus TaxID=582475 RepID=UPI002B243369|nr:Fic family protein [Lysinibacillus xylanilyticus]MEB2281645.1 Fic family protein [Lysinibacillus xylanilyticus]